MEVDRVSGLQRIILNSRNVIIGSGDFSFNIGAHKKLGSWVPLKWMKMPALYAEKRRKKRREKH